MLNIWKSLVAILNKPCDFKKLLMGLLLLLVFVCTSCGLSCINVTCDLCNNTCVNGKCVIQIPGSPFCDCKYGWGGHACNQSVTNVDGTPWSVVRWGLGIFCLSCLCAWSIILLLVLAITDQQKQPIAMLVLVFCFCSAFVRIFYFALDPFGWNGVVPICAIYAIDFVSLSFVGIAYMLMLILWIAVVEHVELKKNGGLFVSLRVFCIFSVIILALVVAPASSIACLTLRFFLTFLTYHFNDLIIFQFD